MNCRKCGGHGREKLRASIDGREGLVFGDPCDRCGGSGFEPSQPSGPGPSGGCLSIITNWIAGIVARIFLLVIGIAVVGAVIFGATWWKSRNHGLVEARPSAEVTTDGYAIGTCLTDPFGAAVPVDCAQPHDGEVYRILEAKDPDSEAYPGNGRLDDFAGQNCKQHVEAYVGSPLSESDLSIGSRSPTETEWRIGSRRVLCFAGGGTQGSLTGTIAGSGGRSGG